MPSERSLALPLTAFFRDAQWAHLDADWRQTLAPFYDTARRMLGVAVNPRMTTTDVVYLFRTDGRMKPFILQDAVAPTVDFLGEGSDRAFLTNQYLFGVRAVRAAGYGQWAYALKGEYRKGWEINA